MIYRIIKRTFYKGNIKYIPQCRQDLEWEDLYERYNMCDSRRQAIEKIEEYKEMFEYTDEIEEL
jgi:hypothetical protein